MLTIALGIILALVILMCLPLIFGLGAAILYIGFFIGLAVGFVYLIAYIIGSDTLGPLAGIAIIAVIALIIISYVYFALKGFIVNFSEIKNKSLIFFKYKFLRFSAVSNAVYAQKIEVENKRIRDLKESRKKNKEDLKRKKNREFSLKRFKKLVTKLKEFENKTNNKNTFKYTYDELKIEVVSNIKNTNFLENAHFGFNYEINEFFMKYETGSSYGTITFSNHSANSVVKEFAKLAGQVMSLE